MTKNSQTPDLTITPAEMNRMIRDFVKASKEDLYEPLDWFSDDGGNHDI